MDKVRFGRALGYGARHAAKSLQAAAEAAAAPSQPSSIRKPQATGSASRESFASPDSHSKPALPGKRRSGVPSMVQQVVRGATQVRSAQSVAGKQVRHSFLGPLAKFSSVVSLQVTGTFFALIALIMAQAAWRSRGALHGGAATTGAGRFYLVAAVGLSFAYFAASNFIRASRRDRR